jgi:hypothetical protein
MADSTLIQNLVAEALSFHAESTIRHRGGTGFEYVGDFSDRSAKLLGEMGLQSAWFNRRSREERVIVYGDSLSSELN